MAIRVPLRTGSGFAVVVFSAACAFHAVVHAASPVPDRVSLSELTMTWSTVKYATDAENGFVSGSLDKKTIVDRTFRTHVLENCYLKVTLAARIRRTHSFHHLQADRPRTALSHRSRRALRDQGRHLLLRLDDGVWRHLPHIPGSRARQDVAEAVGFQGGEGECRRSDGVDVAERRFRLCGGAGEVQDGLDRHRSHLLCHAEGRSRRARYARGAEKSATTGRSTTSTGPARRSRRDRTRNIPEPPAAPKSSRRSRPTARRTGRPICPTATRAWVRARAVSKSCATSGTGRRWASPMRRPICRAAISGA